MCSSLQHASTASSGTLTLVAPGHAISTKFPFSKVPRMKMKVVAMMIVHKNNINS